MGIFVAAFCDSTANNTNKTKNNDKKHALVTKPKNKFWKISPGYSKKRFN